MRMQVREHRCGAQRDLRNDQSKQDQTEFRSWSWPHPNCALSAAEKEFDKRHVSLYNGFNNNTHGWP
jgi:hypothetical protein